MLIESLRAPDGRTSLTNQIDSSVASALDDILKYLNESKLVRFSGLL